MREDGLSPCCVPAPIPRTLQRTFCVRPPPPPLPPFPSLSNLPPRTPPCRHPPPLGRGRKPFLSLPPIAVVTYESTMLTAILFTIIGIVFESRLPAFKQGLYDTRITEGYIGVLVNVEEGQLTETQTLLTQAGAIDVVRNDGGPAA